MQDAGILFLASCPLPPASCSSRITMSGAVTMERFKFYVAGVKVTPTLTPHQ